MKKGSDIIVRYEDCVDGVENLELGCVDLIITSPPYKDEDSFEISFLSDVFEQLYRVTKNKGLFFLNFGHLVEDKFRPFRVCQVAMACGWKLNDTIVWVKNHFSPIQGKRRLNNLSEFIFLLYKGKMPELDRLSIGVPYKDKSNVGRYNDQDLRCRGNVWNIPYDTIQKKAQKLHNDRFPLQLPRMCIKLAGLKPGSWVCDPFLGSGTTAVAAKQLGMNFFGFEQNEQYQPIIEERLKCLQTSF